MSALANTRLTSLPNGLRVATCEVSHAETAAMGIWAGVGGRHESARLSGISHFIEHMLFKGTGRRSARRIMEEVEGVGGDMNAVHGGGADLLLRRGRGRVFPPAVRRPLRSLHESEVHAGRHRARARSHL